jgi:glycosylphosphatidylinositol transamidase (GPIT) subunit GPI8
MIYYDNMCFCSQHHVDPAIGVYIIDRYTYYALDFLEKVEPDSKQSMGEFVSFLFAT